MQIDCGKNKICELCLYKYHPLSYFDVWNINPLYLLWHMENKNNKIPYESQLFINSVKMPQQSSINLSDEIINFIGNTICYFKQYRNQQVTYNQIYEINLKYLILILSETHDDIKLFVIKKQELIKNMLN